MRGRYLLERAGTFVAVVAGIILLNVAFVAFMLSNNGYRTLVMQTDSMYPLLARGDIVIIEPIAPERIKRGDIITFDPPTGRERLVTHRVLEVNEGPDGPLFRTGGDNSDAVDPWEFSFVDEGWRYAGSIPYAGHPVLLAQGPHGRTIGLAVVFVLTGLIVWPAIPTWLARENQRSENW